MKTERDFDILAAWVVLAMKDAGTTQERIDIVRDRLSAFYKQGIRDERKRQAKNRERAKKAPKKSKRGGWETPGHPDGCRCYPHCDPSR